MKHKSSHFLPVIPPLDHRPRLGEKNGHTVKPQNIQANSTDTVYITDRVN